MTEGADWLAGRTESQAGPGVLFGKDGKPLSLVVGSQMTWGHCAKAGVLRQVVD